MDVPTLMHNLKEEVTCSICIHLYQEPKQLPCLHIFCLVCLNDLAKTSARLGKIKCPLCQIEVAVPESGTMESLPDCFYLKNLLDILAIKECSTSKVTCGNCDTKSEEASYCFHCCKFWCKVCLNGHNILRENKEHRVLGLKDFEQKDFEDVLKRPAFCPKELHEKGVFKFYCKVCEVPACQTCVTLEHSRHDVEHLEIIARAVKNDIASQLDTAKKSSNEITNIIRELEEQSRLTEHQSQIVKGQIQKTFKTLILTLEQQERELVTEVENRSKETQDKLRKERDEFQERLNNRTDTISQVERLVERSTGAELVSTKTFVNELFQELQGTQEIPTLQKKSPAIVFLKNQKVPEFLQEARVGHIHENTTDASQCSVERFQEATAGLKTQFDVITRNSEREQCYCPGDYIAVEIMSTQGEKLLPADTDISDNDDGSYTVSFIPSEAGQYKLTVQVNGENIGVSPVPIKERSFRPVKSIKGYFGGKKLVSPWGVVVDDSNEIVLSDLDKNRLLVFDERGEFIRSFGENCVDKPTGIAIDNDGRTFVVNKGSQKVLLFNANGKYIKTVNDKVLLKTPRGISIDFQGNIAVCSSESNCVQVLSVDGTFRRTLGAGKLMEPFDCLYHKDRIYVSDRAGNAVKVFSHDGEFLFEIGKPGSGEGEVNRPTGLGIDRAGQLLVCCEKTARVQIYNPDGTYITRFGGKGQFSLPNSVAVFKDGRIVVTDFTNGRLQFFN